MMKGLDIWSTYFFVCHIKGLQYLDAKNKKIRKSGLVPVIDSKKENLEFPLNEMSHYEMFPTSNYKYFQEECSVATSTGLNLTLNGSRCEEELPTLCEYIACYSTDGFQCIFPFIYKGEEYKQCIYGDVFKPWCPIGLYNLKP